MTSAIRVVAPLASSIALLLAPTQAAEISKLNNTDALNVATSWNGIVVPGVNDVGLFNSAISSPFSVVMGGDLSWQGLRVTNVGGTRNAGSNAVVVTNASSANTLTLGSAGIDMASALQAFAIQSRLTLTANQTWNVTNANSNGNPAGLSQNEDLAFLSQAANIPVNLGGFAVTKTGSGTVAFSSGYTISNGAFDVNAGVLHIQGGGSRVTTVDNSVSFNVTSGATLRFGAQSGTGGITTQVNAPITLGSGSTFALHLNQTNTINLTGNITAAGNNTWSVFGGSTGNLTTFSGNLIGSGNITYANTNTNASGVLRMSGDNSGYAGVFSINGASGTRALRLSGANAGSANATWNIAADNALQVDGQSVQLGTLTGAGSIANSHASVAATINVGAGVFSGPISNGATSTTGLTKGGPGTLLLTGANTYTGATTVNGGVLMTTAAQTGSTAVTVADAAVFGITSTLAGGTFATGTLTSGTTTGATVRFDTGIFGNPTVPVITAVDFVPAAPTQLQVLGTNLSTGTITLVDYSGGFGSGSFNDFSLALPFRVSGSLVHNVGNTSLDVNITGVETPRWRGEINGDWNIDPDNTGATGTPNWLTSGSFVPTRYVEGVVGVDSVIFDDSGANRNINLTTTLSPRGVLVNNSFGPYTFSGSGKISGTGTLVKRGLAMLTIANTATNDFTGGTTISAGALRLGDGVTAGAGQISGPITNNSLLVLEHADDQTISNPISGTGAVTKLGPSITTLTGNLSYTGATTVLAGVLAHNTSTSLTNIVTIASAGTLRLDHATGTVTAPITNNGTLHLNGAASMNVPISGTGGLLVNSTGTKAIGGAESNTFTGTTVVNAGTLNLAKTAGAVAISGDLIVNGGALTVGALGDQFADTSNITVNTGTINTANRADTVANVTIHSTAISTLSGLNITGALTITAGAQQDVVNSGGTTTAHTVDLSNTSIRLGANSGPSTLNIGAGGLKLTNANVVYGSAGNSAQTGTVVLGGNVTASGVNSFDVNTGNPVSVIDLGGASRGFNLLDGTTTVEASIRSSTPGVGLTVSGAGTLILAPGTNGNGASSYAGPTIITGATLLVNGSLSGSEVIADDGGTLGGNGKISPLQWVVLEDTSKLSPGPAAGLAGTLTIDGNLEVFGATRHPGSAALQFDLDLPTTSDRVVLEDTGQLYIGDGALEFDDFLFTTLAGFADQTTYTLFETNSAMLGFLGPNTGGTINGLAASIQLADNGTDLVLVVPEPGSAMLILGGIGLLGMRRSRQKTIPNCI